MYMEIVKYHIAGFKIFQIHGIDDQFSEFMIQDFDSQMRLPCLIMRFLHGFVMGFSFFPLFQVLSASGGGRFLNSKVYNIY